MTVSARRSISPYVVESLARYPSDLALKFRFGDCNIQLKTNSLQLIDHLSEYFRPFVTEGERPDIVVTAVEGEPPIFPFPLEIKPPDPGKDRIKEEFADLDDGRVVRKRLTGMFFIFGGGTNLVVGEAVKNYNQVVNFINNRYIEWLVRSGCLLGHAAGVTRDGRGVAVAGFSGMGKSTLALHLMSHDLNFVSNDRLLIKLRDGQLMMHGVPKQPRINPGTVLNNPVLSTVMPPHEQVRARRLSAEELWKLEQKYDVIIDDVYGEDRFTLESPMLALYLLNWHRDGSPTRVTEVDLKARRDLLPAFVKNLGLFFDPMLQGRTREQSDEDYTAHLAHCRVFEVSGGVDFDYAADAALEVLGVRPRSS